jgi:hypothetical protein
MRFIPLVLAAILFLFPDSSRARELVLLDFLGYGWETNAFPPSESGDVLEIPVVVDNLSKALGINLEDEELTGRMSGLVSEGAQELSPGLFLVHYSGGELTFHRDPSQDHDFGVDPPNATSPSTFVNGTLCLRGELQDFRLYYHEPTGAGSMEATVVFTEGECLSALSALDPVGFTFGGFLTRSSNGAVVEGYDMQLDGFLEAEAHDEGGECEFGCFALAKARFELEDDDEERDDDGDDDDGEDGHKGDRNDDDDDGSPRDKDGCHRKRRCLDVEFQVEGVLTPCAGMSDFDPTQLDVSVRIGDFLQTLPAGSLMPGGDDDDGEFCWEYTARHACGELAEFELERLANGVWEWEIEGIGIPTTLTLPAGKQLDVQLTIGTMTGSSQVELRDKDDLCVYHNHDDSLCGDSEGRVVIDDSSLVLSRGAQLLASPNPFRKSTTLVLRAPVTDEVVVEIYDLRGRVVRTMYRGPLQTDEQQWSWDGMDASGTPVASGIYFYRVTTATTSRVHKLVRMK